MKKEIRKKKHRMLAAFLCSCIMFTLPGISDIPSVVAAEQQESSLETYAEENNHGHDGKNFEAWDNTDSLPTTAGNYCLTEDVTLSAAWNVPSGTTNLCLNGHTLTGTGNASVIIIPNNVTLNLYDCKDNEGKITGGGITATSALYGGGVNVSGIFYMHGGTITKNQSYVTDDAFHGGGGVYVNDGSFTMYGGCITDSTTKRPSTGSSRAYGGGVDVYKGSFTLSGGTISNNYADNGGNVSVSSDASFTMDDGTISKGNSFNMSSGVYNKGVFMMNKGEISDNKKYGVECVSSKFSMNGGTISGSTFNGVYCTNGDFFMNGGTISGNAPGVSWSGSTTFSVSGDAKVTGNTKNVSLSTGKKIIIMESGLTEGASIGITSSKSPTADEPIDVTGENNADYSEYFFSDDETYKIENSGDGSAQVVQLVKHVHNYTYSGDGAVITESCTCGHSETAALSRADGVNLTYTGYAIEACRITYSDGWAGGTLNLSYSNNINAGGATATISKSGETASLNFDIAKKSLTDSMIALASGPHNYTGSAVTPAVTVTDGSETLVSGTDYTVNYGNNTNAGTATVTVMGKGNYTGTIEKTFEIILTDADQVAAAKEVVMETLGGYTATNSTTKQEIQDKIDTALSNAGISGVDVTVGDIVKTEATTDAEGSISGSVSITKGSASDNVAISKTIEKLPKTEAEKVADAKKVVEEILAGITATDSTTKQEIQDKIDTALTKAGITDVTVTVGDLTKVDATTEAAGSISGNISIVSKNDLGETESVPIIKTIEKLPKTEAEKVADAKKVVEETLAGITATNSTTKQEIQEKIDTALTQAGITEVTVTVGELAKTEATTEAAGSIGGTISIESKNDSGETDSVSIIKTIEKLPKTEAEKVADAKKVVEEILAGITATDSTTKQEIQDKIDTALTKAGITDVTVTVGDLTKVDATTEAAGSIGGTISIESKNDSGETDSVSIIKTIEKLPKTEAEKVADAKKVVEETLAGITATNSTTKQEIQEKIDTALTQAGITEVTVTVGELAKTEATTEAAGSIGGTISIESKNDSGETDSVSIIKTIEKLPMTEAEKVADAKKVVEDVLEEVLAGITTASEVTSEDIQREIDGALTQAGITDVTVTVGDLTKTEATTEEEGSISGSITLVSDNDSDVTDSVPIHKTIAQLHTHSYTWIITKEATADEEGEMTGTCICGEITTETIPKTGESGSGTVIVKEDAENECNGSLEDKEDVKGKVSLTDTEKEQLNTGEDLVIILRLKDVSVAADTQEKTEIQNKLETNTLGTFLDIELLKQIGGTETKITETTDEIEITFEIPEHLRNTDDTMTRTYQIMRNHDGVVDILDVENYDESAHLLTFKTDKFSTYALVYRDDAKNPTDTPGPTETPGTPSPTPVTTETPGTSSPTPITTETPDTSTPTPVPTNTPGTPLPTPVTTATPEIVLSKDALSLNALLNVNQTGKKINIAWGKVEGADGYDVYVQYCGKEFTKKSITAIKSGKTTKVTVKKVNGKPLNQKKIYKIYVLAYKLVDGKKVTLAKTITAHIAGNKNAKYTNVKVVKVKKSSYSLKQGKTAVIKASTVLVSKGKKQLSNAHAKEFRYATDNKEVATVSKKGKIKAVGKGSCTIYVYARNGCAKKIKVKVK